MRILLAEDELITRQTLQQILRSWGYDVVAVAQGDQALEQMLLPEAPRLALLDWEMPGLTGPELCCKVRVVPTDQPPYLILLTGRGNPQDIAAGLSSGANDYLTKPFHRPELEARLNVARRTLDLQRHLAERVRELESVLAQVKQLRGMLPICAWCKKVRNDQNYWQQVEEYIGQHSGVTFSHGICPACMAREARSWRAGTVRCRSNKSTCGNTLTPSPERSPSGT